MKHSLYSFVKKKVTLTHNKQYKIDLQRAESTNKPNAGIKQCTKIFLLEIRYARASTTWGNLYGTIMPRWHCVTWRSRVTCKMFAYFQTYILDISDRLKQHVKARLTSSYILLANWVNVKNGVHQVDRFHFFIVRFQISMCKLLSSLCMKHSRALFCKSRNHVHNI